jgi:RNA recognition motif-containing protein
VKRKKRQTFEQEETPSRVEVLGQASLARIPKDRYNGRSRGFGFVEMPNQGEAKIAIKNFNGKELLGQGMNVNEAHPHTDWRRSRKKRSVKIEGA